VGFTFTGTGPGTVSLAPQTCANATCIYASGSASGSGTLASGGSYILSAPPETVITATSQGNGNLSVSQSGPLTFNYAGVSGSLLAGNFTFTSLLSQTRQDSSGQSEYELTGSAGLVVTGGTLSGAGTGLNVTINFAVPQPIYWAPSIDTIATSGGSINASIYWPTLIAPVDSSLQLDPYGGLVGKPCPSGPQPHFYAQKTGSRWHLCTPAGNAFWMNGVYHVAADDTGADYQGIVLANVVSSKYATGQTSSSALNWVLQAMRRMQSWGFNTINEFPYAYTRPVATDYRWGTSDHTIPIKLPFTIMLRPSWYSFTNLNNWANGAVKDITQGVKSTVYSGYRTQSPDFWDPNFAQFLLNELKNEYWVRQAYTGPHNDYLIGLTVDDSQTMLGFGPGPDFPTVSNGVVSPGFDQPHLSWLILVTAPTQSSNSSFGVTYPDTTVYSKGELNGWLAARYTNSIAALNAAWRSNYTTFGSSGGWGIGSGLIDEDGTCPSRISGQVCWVPTDPKLLTGASGQMQQDLDDFLLHHAQKYFSVIKAVLQAEAPGILYFATDTIGGWGTPPRRQILQAAGQYADVLILGGIPPNCTNCADIQQRIDFVAQYGGDIPWTNWEGYQAKADSYMSPYASSSDQLQTEAARGRLYQQRMQQFLSSQDTLTRTYHLVGLKWWELYDNRAEKANRGLVTRRDDPYDGVSATTKAGTDAWGYPTGCLPSFGCEWGNYGDFIDPVRSANFNAFRSILAGP
jgi:hypothetical protein